MKEQFYISLFNTIIALIFINILISMFFIYPSFVKKENYINSLKKEKKIQLEKEKKFEKKRVHKNENK